MTCGKELISFIVALFISNLLVASPFFDGQVYYRFNDNNSQVTLSYDKISNSQNNYTTGTIKVSLWACNTPYQGGKMYGTRIAEFTKKGLHTGEYWHSGRQTINATHPPTHGYYNMVMTVEEYTNGGYRITDWINFSKTTYLQRPPPPKPKAPQIRVKMEGPYRWQTYPSDKKIEIRVGKITHNRNGNTGTLSIKAWATQQPYKGGQINGYILGEIRKEALHQGMMYPQTHQYVEYNPPPPGHYYVTLALMEYDGRVYRIMDHYTFDGTHTFN